MKIYLTLIFVTGLLVPVISQASVTLLSNLKVLPQPRHTQPQIKHLSFTAIRSTGNIQLQLHPVPSNRLLSVITSAKNKQPISIKIRNHTLYLSERANDLSQPIKVTVRINQINRLFASGNTEIRGKNIRSQGLVIQAKDHSTINLSGSMVVNKISASGSSRIKLRSLKSKILVIRSKGDSLIQLAGKAYNIRARLYDHSQLNAQYLRAQTMMIQTKGQASAKIAPIYSLRAFAADKSNIYYYKIPKNITWDTTDSGNVLQMNTRG